jgi:peptide/nickel transport system substrate-binding protein
LPFKDIKVRQALMMATDFDTINKTMRGGTGLINTFPVTPVAAYIDAYLPLDQATPAVQALYKYNPDQAKKLLTEAGYPNGFLTNVICSNPSATIDYLSVVKDMWSKIGVNCQIMQVESGAFDDNYMKNNFDITAQYWSDDIPDPSEEVSYACVFANSESFHSGFQNDEIDQLAADALKETDEAKRKQMYFRIQEIMNDQVPLIPLLHDPFLVAIRKNVKNFVQTSLGTYIWRELDLA